MWDAVLSFLGGLVSSLLGRCFGNRTIAQAARAETEAAYANRDNAALAAENDELCHQLEKAHEEKPATSYDGDPAELAAWVRRHNAGAE